MSTELKRTVIIAAGGSGSRMGSELPKQFLDLQGKTIIEHTIDRFKSVYPSIEVIAVLPKDHFHYLDHLDCQRVEGGTNRFESVKKGLNSASGDLIAVHDAVRPFVKEEVILSAFDTAEVAGAAVPVLPIKDSLRQITSDESIAVDRSLFRIVQTPQVFKRNILKLAYEQQYSNEFTDDASVVESCGQDIVLVDGNEENIKITTPIDLLLANQLIG
jgi:2-C-methyl-D-erythritol 4-phosphate cytidylyltransferase